MESFESFDRAPPLVDRGRFIVQLTNEQTKNQIFCVVHVLWKQPHPFLVCSTPGTSPVAQKPSKVPLEPAWPFRNLVRVSIGILVAWILGASSPVRWGCDTYMKTADSSTVLCSGNPTDGMASDSPKCNMIPRRQRVTRTPTGRSAASPSTPRSPRMAIDDLGKYINT